jgi:hypothetical protein
MKHGLAQHESWHCNSPFPMHSVYLLLGGRPFQEFTTKKFSAYDLFMI